MLDINLFRTNPEVIIKDLEKRKYKDKLPLVEKIIKLDKDWRKLIQKVDELRQVRNKVSKEIGMIKNTNERKKLIKQMQDNNDLIKKNEKSIEKKKSELNELLIQVPNLMHKSVPYGKDDSENVELKLVGKKPEFNFEIKNHQEICEKNDWYDIVRGAKVSGARNYFLKNNLARLEQALINYAIDFLMKKGFIFMTVPCMCNEECFFGTGFLPYGKEDLYNITNEKMNLIGTSEVPLTSYHMNETLLEKDLPKKFCGLSTCFRTEAGSHGKDSKGIFRVHQFNKVEMVILCKPDESIKMHESLLKVAEEFWKSLGLHYRVVNICTGDLGVVASKKYDIEAWFPGQNKYMEVVSCSMINDYQARRLNIKYREMEGKAPIDFVHTLNSTCVATTRALVCLIETYQTKAGRVKIPKVLQAYMNGLKVI